MHHARYEFDRDRPSRPLPFPLPTSKALENYLREQNINPKRVCQGKRRDFRRLISAVRANRFQLRPGILYPRIIVLSPPPPPLFLSIRPQSSLPPSLVRRIRYNHERTTQP